VDSLNNIIYLVDLKKELKIKKESNDRYDEFKNKIRIMSLAFSMNEVYSPSSHEKDILHVANDMGFFVDKEIHFDFTRPDSEANKIMVEVNSFKNDIIDQINEAIKKFKDNYDGYNEIEVKIDLETLLDKYDIQPLLFHTDYSFQWLKNKLHSAGYIDYTIDYIGVDQDCLIYKICISWE
jgi:hypothetical protein